MKSMKISSKINALMLLVLTVAMFVILSLQLRIAAGDQLNKEAVNQTTEFQNSISKIEVNFKTQVQEWKNVLLRGNNADDLTKYKSRFFERDEDVRRGVNELMTTTGNEANLAQLEKFAQEHKALGKYYRSALVIFEESSVKSPYKADAAVRGKDRLPAKSLQTITTQLIDDLNTLLEQQTYSRHTEQRNQLYVIVGLFVTLFLFAHWMSSLAISKPLAHTLASVKLLASGDAGTTVRGLDRKDEIGDLATAVEHFRKNTLENQRLTKNQQEHFAEREKVQAEIAVTESKRHASIVLDAERQRELAVQESSQAKLLAERINALLLAVDAASQGDLYYPIEQPDDTEDADDLSRMSISLIRLFEELRKNFKEIGNSADNLTFSATGLEKLGSLIMKSAAQNSDQTSRASTTAVEVTGLVGSVAVATEQMSISIRAIATSVGSAAQVAERAVSLVESTDVSVRQLAESSADIGTVIKVITSIAEQTNLLALNATIEAARAGDAGKGFAVVANEVKDLAKETARATEEIEKRIASIQSNTHQAVAAIGDISEIVREISETQTTIAAAVEKQNATTDEINRTVEATVNQNSAISQVIDKVAITAGENRDSATGIQSAAIELSSMATRLQSSVTRFSKAA